MMKPMAAADRINMQVLPTGELTRTLWDEIWSLTAEFYEVEREYAESELRKRQQVALFRVAGRLQGMVSLDVYPATFGGRRIAVISTTYTLIRESWRGRNLLQKLGLRTFLATRLRHPFRPIYWFFDTFSYKSYLLLPRNLEDYWPRHDRPTPADATALIDQLAVATYGPAWRPARGVAVRSGRKRMRATAAPLDHGGDPSPDVAFFVRANPGHAEGDVLVCLCPLTLRNWYSIASKALRRLKRPRTD